MSGAGPEASSSSSSSSWSSGPAKGLPAAGAGAPGAPAVVSRGSRRRCLSAEEAALWELAQAAGAALDPEVFKILLDLLRMNVAPLAIFQMLRSMCAGQRLSCEATSESAREAPIVSAKTSKIPAPLSVASVLRAPRIRVTKAVAGSPAAAGSPLSQGRTRAIAAATGAPPASEQSHREGSVQRVPRQPSASRLQKAGCPGKSV